MQKDSHQNHLVQRIHQVFGFSGKREIRGDELKSVSLEFKYLISVSITLRNLKLTSPLDQI